LFIHYIRLTTFARQSSGTTEEVTTTTTTSRCNTIRIKYYFSRCVVVPRKLRTTTTTAATARRCVERTAINSFSVYTLNRVNGRRSLISCLCLFPGIIYYDYYYGRRRRGRRPTDHAFVRACVRVTHRRGPVCPYRAEYAAATYTFTTAATERCRQGTLYYYNRTTVCRTRLHQPLVDDDDDDDGTFFFVFVVGLRSAKFEIPPAEDTSPRSAYMRFTTRSQNPALTAVYFYTVIIRANVFFAEF